MVVAIELLIRRASTAAAALAARHGRDGAKTATTLAFVARPSLLTTSGDGASVYAPDGTLAAASAQAWERRLPSDGGGATARHEALASLPVRDGTVGEVMSLGTSWHVLHYLLSGRSGLGDRRPEASLLDGVLIEDQQGARTGRWLSPAETRAFAEAVERIDAATIDQRIDPRRMQLLEIHGCESVTPACRERIRTCVESHLPTLRRFLREAAAHDEGLLLWFA